MALFLTLLSLVLCYFSPGELFPSMAPYHLQQIIILPAIAISLTAMTMRRSTLQSPQYILMIGLWFAVVMSLLSKFWLRSSLNGFMDFGIVISYYFLVLTNAFTTTRVRLICATLTACAAVMSIQGILAYHTGYMAAKYLHIQMASGFALVQRIRALGILNDANDLAQFLLVGLAMLGVFWKPRNRATNVVMLGVPAAIIMYGVYLTGSRGAIVGLVVIVFAVASSRLGGLQSLVLAGFFFLVLVAAQFGAGREMSLHESSAGGRVVAWGEGISMLKTNPLFGVGFGQFTEHNELTAHNSFVLCFAELGVFGYFFWLALVVTTLLGLQSLARAPVKTPADADLRRCATTIRTALYCLLATSWFLSRTYNVTLYVVLAIAAAAIHLRRETSPEGAAIPARQWIPLTVALQAASIVVIYATIRIRNM